MFVRQSKYDTALRQVTIAELRLSALQDQWNSLICRINKKGGEPFLRKATLTPAIPLNEGEIVKLIQLCHPDKHDGKPMATEMTQKLLELKNMITKG